VPPSDRVRRVWARRAHDFPLKPTSSHDRYLLNSDGNYLNGVQIVNGTWIILLSDDFKGLGAMAEHLKKLKLPVHALDTASFEVADGRCIMKVWLSDQSHVAEESAEISRVFPHTDASEIAVCTKRLDLSCSFEHWPEATNLVAWIEGAASISCSKCWLFDPMLGSWM
jgi:hypothetical protein